MPVWRINSIKTIKKKSGKLDVVCSVNYDCVDKKRIGDWEPEGIVNGDLELNTEDLSVFKAYADLKESDVLGWIRRDLGDAKVAEIEAQAAAKLAARMNPILPAAVPRSMFPWS